jgi:hypothetical protein
MICSLYELVTGAGTYKLQVVVFGNGLAFDTACISGVNNQSITLTSKLASDWVGTLQSVPNKFDATNRFSNLPRLFSRLFGLLPCACVGALL